MSKAFNSSWAARVGRAKTDTVAVPVASLPPLEKPVSLLSEVLARHPHLACTNDTLLAGLEDRERTAELYDTAALRVARHQLEAALAAQSPEHADILEAMHVDLDEQDRLYAALDKAAPAFVEALKTGAPVDALVEKLTETLDCGPISKKKKKRPEVTEAAVGLEHGMRHQEKKEMRKKQRDMYGEKLDEWCALSDPEFTREMMDAWMATDPGTLRAYIDAGLAVGSAKKYFHDNFEQRVDLQGIKGFFRRNFGGRNTREKQALKDARKARQRREAKEKGEDEYGLGHVQPDDEETIEAEMIDNGADDPFASDYAREQQRLAIALDDGVPLEVNIFKKIKEAAGKLKRRAGGTPDALALEPFSKEAAMGPDDGGRLLSLLAQDQFGRMLGAVGKRGNTRATRATFVTRTLREGGAIDFVLNEKQLDVRTIVIGRDGEFADIGGTKLLEIDLRRYNDRFQAIEFVPGVQFELSVRLDENELAQMDSAKREKGKITLHLRPTSDVDNGATSVYYTTHGNPLVIFRLVNGVIAFVYLAVLPADVQPADVLKSYVQPMTTWIEHAAQSKQTLMHAHEELRSYALLPAISIADKRAQARANHVLEEVLRQRLMGALEYAPTKGIYPVATMLSSKAEKPDVTVSQALRSAMGALIRAPAAVNPKDMAAALLQQLAPTLADPATLRSVAGIVSQALHAGGARTISLEDAAARITNLWNPDYKQKAYFKFDA